MVIKPDFVLTKGLYSEPLFREPFVLITQLGMNGENPLALMRATPLYPLYSHIVCRQDGQSIFTVQALDAKIALEIDEIDAIVRIVEYDLDVALVPLAGNGASMPNTCTSCRCEVRWPSTMIDCRAR